MRWRLRGYLRRTITYRWARRIAVAVIGGSIVLLGIAMVVLPGPAIIVIPLGLGVLATSSPGRALAAQAPRDRARRREPRPRSPEGPPAPHG